RVPAFGQNGGGLERKIVHVLDARGEVPLAQQGNSLGRGEKAGRIAGRGMLELATEALLVTPRYDREAKGRLPLGRRPQDAAAARRIRPLVQVRGIPIDAE